MREKVSVPVSLYHYTPVLIYICLPETYHYDDPKDLSLSVSITLFYCVHILLRQSFGIEEDSVPPVIVLWESQTEQIRLPRQGKSVETQSKVFLLITKLKAEKYAAYSSGKKKKKK